jgi:hypothetical protein
MIGFYGRSRSLYRLLEKASNWLIPRFDYWYTPFHGREERGGRLFCGDFDAALVLELPHLVG